MNRTRADALAMVNWKGVFYERYLLDRHVTALEGANGAGKTTVMIAAYVVLLPDMSRLRFTNLGETGATGGDKGIWGRLGEPGRPSYAAMDFALAGKHRLVAGVHLERKGEPSVEPTPFIISGLGDDVRLQDLLLMVQGDTEVVPELHELRENAARLGGRLQVFPSARDYFAALFDQGVTPLRLGTDEERNKLNEMLRTSMTGGISRALTSELRDFLLKEEGGLADTLHRMKANLDACRRTRTEVQESRRLEQEIGGVFKAGQTMFAAAFLATRERADDLSRRVAEAEGARTTAVQAQTAAADALAQTVSALGGIEAQREEIEHVLESAKAWVVRIRDALAAADELARSLIAFQAAGQEFSTAAATRAQADDVRSRRRDELRRAQENYKRAASGLADIQRGAEELLGGVSVAASDFDEHLARAQSELAAVDRARREASTRLADADEHRRRHAEVLAALRFLVSGDVPIGNAVGIATDALRRYRDQVAVAGRVSSLTRDLGEARKLAERQARVRTLAERLDVVLSQEPAGAMVRSRLEGVEAQRAQHEEAERSARVEFENVCRRLNEFEGRRHDLAASEPEWREHDARARRLGEHLGSLVLDRASLDTARGTVAERLASIRQAEEATLETQERLIREARELIAAGGPFALELLRLKDQIGADLVAGSFEDIGLNEAGVLEARLGPLAQALVVDDPHSAALTMQSRPQTLVDVLLVSRDANLEDLASSAVSAADGAADVVVDEGIALRVSRIPVRPRLGRRAREARASELRIKAEEMVLEIEELRAKRRHLERLTLDGEALLAGHAIWLGGNPAPELADVRRKITEAEAQIELLRAESVRHAESSRTLRPRIDGLRGLLSEAFLLDPPDHVDRLQSIEGDYQSALAAQVEVARVSPAA